MTRITAETFWEWETTNKRSWFSSGKPLMAENEVKTGVLDLARRTRMRGYHSVTMFLGLRTNHPHCEYFYFFSEITLPISLALPPRISGYFFSVSVHLNYSRFEDEGRVGLTMLRKKLEKAWFSVLLFGFICIGVFRVFQDPGRKIAGGGREKEPETVAGDGYFRHKHVTRPMERRIFALSDHVIFFNRVPKSGSEMLVLLLQWLQGVNGFRHIRLRGGEKRRLNLPEQEELVEEMINKEKEEAIPVSFDRHVHFINFTKFDKQSPMYINLVRDPVDRAISRFYYKRVTSNPNNPDIKGMGPEKRVPSSAHSSFEECFMDKDPECSFLSGYSYDLSIPYFCGQHYRCTVLNDKWAVQKAKENVEKYFPVVGVLEELNSTLLVLERKIPMFFKGVQNMYYNELLEPHRNANRMKPRTTNPFVRSQLKRQLLTEYDFYYWIKARIIQQSRELGKTN